MSKCCFEDAKKLLAPDDKATITFIGEPKKIEDEMGLADEYVIPAKSVTALNGVEYAEAKNITCSMMAGCAAVIACLGIVAGCLLGKLFNR